jgi:hypothetical protein
LGGSFDVARDLCDQSRRRLDELGLRVEAAAMVLESSGVEILAGDYVAAEQELRRGFNVLETLGERYVLSMLSGLLAQTLWSQDRPDEADDMSAHRCTGAAFRPRSSHDVARRRRLWSWRKAQLSCSSRRTPTFYRSRPSPTSARCC